MPVTINGTSGLVTATTFSGSSLTGIDTGKVLQIQTATKTNQFSETLATGAISSSDISGLSVRIINPSPSNKILLLSSFTLSSYNNDVLIYTDG